MLRNLFVTICTWSLLAVTTGVPALADSSSDIEKRLQQEFSGTNVFLRSALVDDSLRFDSDGHSKSTETGPWTIASVIAIHDIHYKDASIEIEGERILLYHDAAPGKFRSVFPIPVLQKGIEVLPGDKKQAKKAEKKKLAQRNRVHLTISRPPGELTSQAVLDIMAKVFVPPSERISDAVPIYWRDYLRRQEGPPEEKPAGASTVKVYSVGKTVTPPKATHQPDPEYPLFARQLRYEGGLGLTLIVNTEGQPTDIQITKPAGLGLDEKAVEAVRGWKFNPGMRDGNAVPVKIAVEVQFHLF